MAGSVEMLLIGRLLVGLASGLTTSTVPMYLAELAPLSLRGTLGVFCSMGITGGVVVGQIGSLQEVFGTTELWHVSFSVFAVLVIICLLPYPWYPESPKFLYIVARNPERAREGTIEVLHCFMKYISFLLFLELLKLRGYRATIVDEEILLMQNEISSEVEKRSLWSVLKDPTLFLPVALVCILQGGQQLSGINAVFYYSVIIFESAGLSPSNAKWANLGAGCINLFIAGFSPLLMAKVNRRPLILWSCFVAGVFLTILTIIVLYIVSVW